MFFFSTINEPFVCPSAEFQCDEDLLEVFKTDFQLRLLWGSRGASVNQSDRYSKFNLILTALSRKLEPPPKTQTLIWLQPGRLGSAWGYEKKLPRQEVTRQRRAVAAMIRQPYRLKGQFAVRSELLLDSANGGESLHQPVRWYRKKITMTWNCWQGLWMTQSCRVTLSR